MLTQAQKNLRGIAAMAFAMACFSLNDAIVKLGRQEWPTGEVLVVRGAFSLAFLVVWLLVAKQGQHIRLLLQRPLYSRAVLEGAIASAFITAIGLMAFADVTAMLMMAPLLITALSMIVFGEKVGWRRWSAVIVGFCGMLLVVRPGGSDASAFALGLAFASVIGVAVRDLSTRRFALTTPTIVIAIASTIGTFTAGALLVALGQAWVPVTPKALMMMAGAAFFVVIGNYAIVAACRDVELSVVTPFRYTVIIWVVGLGFFVFGEWPSGLTMLGILLIIGSGLYTLHRERVRQKLDAGA